jgi:nitrogen regulatory protein P-II 1
MKLIIAIVRPERLEAVQAALGEPGVSLLSVSKAADVKEPTPRELWRGLEVRVPRPRLRLEVAVVNETLLSSTVRAISHAAVGNGRGRAGDGEIFVTPMDDYFRIPVAEVESAAADDEGDHAIPPINLDRVI